MEHGALTIDRIRDGLTKGEFSVAELTDAALNDIAQRDVAFSSFLRVREHARNEAQAADERLASGAAPRPLEGVTIAVKDNMVMEGEIVTAASKILEHYRAPYTATVIERLRAAGAIIVGKTNLDEFAMGASTENSAYGPTRNPWNPGLVPGGSSGGSAAAVAAGFSVAALGSDTGGSIRQPAGFCNVVGMKPTYGRVSRYGLIALASSLDQIGPFGRTVRDAAEVYQAIAGHDESDATSVRRDDGNPLATIDHSIKGLRIGLPTEFFGEGVDPRVRDTVMAAANVFEKLGATLVEVSTPHAPNGLATYYVLQPAEASSNLARFDGVRYGLSDRSGGSLREVYVRSRGKGFGAETKRRIIVGTFALSSGYSDAYYHQANRVRAILTEEFHQVFDQVDLLLSPTSPTLPFALGAKTQDPLTMYLADLLTVPANLTGHPAMSLPAGFVDELPVGMQLIAKHWDEATMFRAGHAYQQETDWHARRPA